MVIVLLLLGDTRAVSLLSRVTIRREATENENVNKQKIWNGIRETVERNEFWIFDRKHQPYLLQRN